MKVKAGEVNWDLIVKHLECFPDEWKIFLEILEHQVGLNVFQKKNHGSVEHKGREIREKKIGKEVMEIIWIKGKNSKDT